MKKKLLTFLGCFIFSLALLWSIVFTTDYYRSGHLMRPLFVVGISETLADDGGSGSYQGVGYTVDVKGHLSAEFGYVVESVEMQTFGKIISASVS